MRQYDKHGQLRRQIRQQDQPFVHDYRLSLDFDTPFPEADIGGAQVYAHSINRGNRALIYEGVTRGWQLRTGEDLLSVDVPSTKFRGYDVFMYWNGHTLALETANWGTSQSTGTITAVTSASPPQITSTGHGLTDGDLIGIDDITGTIGTNTDRGLNDTFWTVLSVVDANNFTIDGADTTALDYVAGGTFWKVNAPNTVEVLNGRLVKQDDPTRLLVGRGMTRETTGNSHTQFGPTQPTIYNEIASWLLENIYNRRPITLRYGDLNNTWSWSGGAWRAGNNRAKLARTEFVNTVSMQEEQVLAQAWGIVRNDTDAPVVAIGIGLNTFLDNFADVPKGGTTAPTVFVQLVSELSQFPIASAAHGLHYFSWIEYGNPTVGTTTFAGDGGTTAQLQTGLKARIWA